MFFCLFGYTSPRWAEQTTYFYKMLLLTNQNLYFVKLKIPSTKIAKIQQTVNASCNRQDNPSLSYNISAVSIQMASAVSIMNWQQQKIQEVIC